MTIRATLQVNRRSTIARNGGTGAGTSQGYAWGGLVNNLQQSLTSGSAVTFTLGYDPSGGLVTRQASNSAYLWHSAAPSTSYTPNGLNQYTVVGGTAMGYDTRQNLNSDGTTGNSLSFDTENKLLTLTTSAPATVTLAYDPTGRILTKTASSATETFLYAGQMLVGEYDSSGNILARYIPGPGQDEAALWYSGAGTTTPQWLHADQQGSTIAWSNGSGAAIGTQAYDPYGQPQAWSGPRFSYTGQLMIAEAQLYHYKARAYDPALGRFMQTDPAGYISDVNPYAYVGNDPVDGADPSGMAGPDEPDPRTNCIGSNEDCDPPFQSLSVFLVPWGDQNFDLCDNSGYAGLPLSDPGWIGQSNCTPFTVGSGVITGNNSYAANPTGGGGKGAGPQNKGCSLASPFLPQGTKVNLPPGYYFGSVTWGLFAVMGGEISFVSGIHVQGGRVAGSFSGFQFLAGLGVALPTGAGINYSDTNPVSGSGPEVQLAGGPVSYQASPSGQTVGLGFPKGEGVAGGASASKATCSAGQ